VHIIRDTIKLIKDISKRRNDEVTKSAYETTLHYLLARKTYLRMVRFLRLMKNPPEEKPPSYKEETFSSESEHGIVRTQQSHSILDSESSQASNAYHQYYTATHVN